GIYTAVSPGFFQTTGTRVLRGRPLGAAGDAEAPFPVVVNEAMARALWPGQDPIGRCVRFREPAAPCATVVGVAQTAILTSIDEEPQPQFYLSLDHPPMEIW